MIRARQKKGPLLLPLHLYSFWLKDQKWLAEQKRFAASAKINESECRNVAYVLQDKEWAVILETKKHPRKLGLIFTTQIVLLLRLSGLPDNLILKPFQTELSQRALFGKVLLVVVLLVVNCLEFENVTFKLSFHYDRWILER